MSEYLTKWFKGRMPYFEEATEGMHNVERVLEVGCWEGQCTNWLAERFQQAVIEVIDTFEGNPEHIEHGKYDLPNLYARFMKNTDHFANRRIIYRGTSEDVLPGIRLARYDFIYIDGSHAARDVMYDAELCWRMLKPGGVMAFDDYTWRQDMPETETPRIAIDAFLRIHANELEVLHKKACVIVRKK